MIKLRPQHLTDHYYDDIERQLKTFFFDEIIAPVLAIVRKENKQPVLIANAAGDASVKAAIRSGRIQYVKGEITGKFSAAISAGLKRVGATFNKRTGKFYLPEYQAPQWLIEEAYYYFVRAKAAHEAIEGELTRAMARVSQSSYLVDAKEMVVKVDGGWRESAKRLEVKPELGADARANLAANYARNLDLYIKKWMKDDILSLRRDVQDNANAGYRFDSLMTKIQQRHSVSKSKAKFLARQETGLYMSEYRAQRFQESGVTKYQWSTSHDLRVRPQPGQPMNHGDHRILDKQIFTYAQKAPARYMSSGTPCNPGQDFNCRCVDIPLLQ